MKPKENHLIVVLRHIDSEPEIRSIAFEQLERFAKSYLNKCEPFQDLELTWKGTLIKPILNGDNDFRVWKVESEIFKGQFTEIPQDSGQVNLGYTLFRKIVLSDLSRRDAMAINQSEEPKIETITPKKRSRKK